MEPPGGEGKPVIISFFDKNARARITIVKGDDKA
jgi:hypothetical protein